MVKTLYTKEIKYIDFTKNNKFRGRKSARFIVKKINGKKIRTFLKLLKMVTLKSKKGHFNKTKFVKTVLPLHLFNFMPGNYASSLHIIAQ